MGGQPKKWILLVAHVELYQPREESFLVQVNLRERHLKKTYRLKWNSGIVQTQPHMSTHMHTHTHAHTQDTCITV